VEREPDPHSRTGRYAGSTQREHGVSLKRLKSVSLINYTPRRTFNVVRHRGTINHARARVGTRVGMIASLIGVANRLRGIPF